PRPVFLLSTLSSQLPSMSIRHSVSQWCFPDIPLPDLAVAARNMGIESIELLEPSDWSTVQKAGLTCAMARAPDTVTDSFNRRENPPQLVPAFQQRLRDCARAGLPNLICFSGNRRGQSDEEGLEICAEGIKQIVGVAEREKVTLCIELLNSKVDHP